MMRNNAAPPPRPDQFIEQLVDEYLAGHPGQVQLTDPYWHPSVIALRDDVMPWMVEQCGGIQRFWTFMLEAAMFWFPEPRQSRLGKLFCTQLEAEANTFWQGSAKFAAIERTYLQWRGSKPLDS